MGGRARTKQKQRHPTRAKNMHWRELILSQSVRVFKCLPCGPRPDGSPGQSWEPSCKEAHAGSHSHSDPGTSDCSVPSLGPWFPHWKNEDIRSFALWMSLQPPKTIISFSHLPHKTRRHNAQGWLLKAQIPGTSIKDFLRARSLFSC